MKTLIEINGVKSENKLQYFGTYMGVEWVLDGLRDGNKVWWYLTENGEENPQPVNNLKEALVAMKENIDYNFIDKH
jgi:hypothetical protein